MKLDRERDTDKEPAEGSRETVDAALRDDSHQPGTSRASRAEEQQEQAKLPPRGMKKGAEATGRRASGKKAARASAPPGARSRDEGPRAPRKKKGRASTSSRAERSARKRGAGGRRAA